MTELPEYERRTTGHDHGERDKQIAAITEIVGTVAQAQRRLEGRINKLAKTMADSPAAEKQEEDRAAPAAWVWFFPPAAVEDEPAAGQDPPVTVENFVTWYNATFVGTEGSRSKPIPACWQQHPGLAMEVAALAYSWRAANIGPSASARESQSWLHQWRPAFADRLTRDWVHADCLDGDHRDGGAPPRENRFAAGQHAAVIDQAR
ncbi:hypothetical protein [Haloechinothrix halophila]|uniref:hypothetical protein n=1 Tax=Haloechinothrix halophila TaxID=1069073 RepID=UPI000421E10F|nr:hypothetical protein [Haloechinothrix halophila]